MKRPSTGRVLARAAAVATLVAVTSATHAQPSGQDVATAQALFDEGKRLMEAGKHAEACPKLQESQRLDPGGGTLLLIALCHEGEGKTATAWADFSVALGEARRDRRTDRERAAEAHLRALEAKLTRVRVVVTARHEGLEVMRDGSRVGDPQWGLPLPVDPGEHAFVARAPGKKTWSKTAMLSGEGAVVDVVVPALEDDVAMSAATAVPAPTPAESPRLNADGAQPAGTDRLPWVIASGAIGLVAVGIGTGFAVAASSKWNEAEAACPGNRCVRESDRELGTTAGARADVATVLFVVGGVGLATAAVLWLTAPREPTSSRSARGPLHVTPWATGAAGGLAVGGAL